VQLPLIQFVQAPNHKGGNTVRLFAKVLGLAAIVALSAVPAVAGPVGNSSTLYVDSNTDVYTVSPSGAVSQLTPGTPFTEARGLAFGPGGLTVADLGAGNVSLVNPSTGAVSGFTNPITLGGAYGVAWSGSTLFVSSFTGSGLNAYNASGTQLGITFTGISGDSLADLAVHNGSLYVSDVTKEAVLKFSLGGGAGTTFASLVGLNGTGVEVPRQISFDANGDLFVADSRGNGAGNGVGVGGYLDEFSPGGTFLTQIAFPDSNYPTIPNANPKGLLVDPITGIVITAESGTSNLQGFNPNGTSFGNDGLAFAPQDLAEAPPPPPSPVPEPTTLALFGLGGAALAAWRLRRKNRKA